MLGIKRITIAQHERGLLFRHRSFKAVLEPGVHWSFDPLKRTEVQVYDLTVPEFVHAPSMSCLATRALWIVRSRALCAPRLRSTVSRCVLWL